MKNISEPKKRRETAQKLIHRKYIYTKPSDNDWYSCEDPECPLPKHLQVQQTKRPDLIKAKYCLSNYKWFTGLMPTGIQQLYFGDIRNQQTGQKELLILHFEPGQLTVYHFRHYEKGMPLNRAFTESFFYNSISI